MVNFSINNNIFLSFVIIDFENLLISQKRMKTMEKEKKTFVVQFYQLKFEGNILVMKKKKIFFFSILFDYPKNILIIPVVTHCLYNFIVFFVIYYVKCDVINYT